VDGVPWAVPPAWVDPLRRPLRNTTALQEKRALDIGRQLLLDVDPAAATPPDPAPPAGPAPPADPRPPPDQGAA
jgi:hypothetical protein